ncbi:MAG TPA: DNA methyltransferase [Ignavibacteriaceae bacterium]
MSIRKKKRAPLNRTLTLSKTEIKSLLKNLIKLKSQVQFSQIKNKIINQDIFSVIDFLPEKFVDLMFIDPPYNLSKKFNSTTFKEMNSGEYKVWFDSWFKKIIELLKPNASVYICSDWKTSQAVVEIGSKYLKLRNRITWEREKGRGSKNNWKNCSEDIWFFTKSDNYTFNADVVKLRRKILAPYRENGKPKDWIEKGKIGFRDTSPSNLWTDISVPFWSMPENTDHPTQKPEKLLAKIILASSNKGDVVFDPFAGSGSSLVTAKKLKRNFVGIELDEIYCCYGLKRLQLADKDDRIQGFENGVFWERNTLREQNKSQKSNIKSR